MQKAAQLFVLGFILLVFAPTMLTSMIHSVRPTSLVGFITEVILPHPVTFLLIVLLVLVLMSPMFFGDE